MLKQVPWLVTPRCRLIRIPEKLFRTRYQSVDCGIHVRFFDVEAAASGNSIQARVFSKGVNIRRKSLREVYNLPFRIAIDSERQLFEPFLQYLQQLIPRHSRHGYKL